MGRTIIGCSEWNSVHGLNDSPCRDYVYDEDNGTYEYIFREEE